MDPMCEVVVPGFLARRLEWMVVSLPEMGKHSKLPCLALGNLVSLPWK